ncbi:MAG: hypothetical protein CM1200mP14_14400 [Gammaproteobacteria bacterium]|nr:MAG: hypothetical protein CM1200mP14_14400 [Gammaproteobacteria bacterium]
MWKHGLDYTDVLGTECFQAQPRVHRNTATTPFVRLICRWNCTTCSTLVLRRIRGHWFVFTLGTHTPLWSLFYELVPGIGNFFARLLR